VRRLYTASLAVIAKYQILRGELVHVTDAVIFEPRCDSTSFTRQSRIGCKTGGPEEDRTPGLIVANDALSQLSYGPNNT